MPLTDNMYHYILYGLILVTFLIVLKMPKKNKDKNDNIKDNDK